MPFRWERYPYLRQQLVCAIPQVLNFICTQDFDLMVGGYGDNIWCFGIFSHHLFFLIVDILVTILLSPGPVFIRDIDHPSDQSQPLGCEYGGNSLRLWYAKFHHLPGSILPPSNLLMMTN